MAFQVVGEQEVDDALRQEARQQQHAKRQEENSAAAAALMLALKSLSQRALTAASTLFTGLGLFSAFWLWRSVLPDPNVNQLIGVSLYAAMFLGLEVIRRRP